MSTDITYITLVETKKNVSMSSLVRGRSQVSTFMKAYTAYAF